MDTTFNKNYYLIRSSWIERQLESLPVVRIGKHKGMEVVREYYLSSSGKWNHHTYQPTNNRYSELIAIARRRERLLKLKKNLPSRDIKVSSIGSIRMTQEQWNQLPQSANPEPIKTEYTFNGIRMRSRFEKDTAYILHSLGLQFKYEPPFYINGEVVYPDFMIYLPELEMCIIIECLGMLDDYRYTSKNSYKINNYLSEGYEIGKDLIFFSGRGNYMPDEIFIRNHIVGTINVIADTSIVSTSNGT